jgi:hypothetical protein
LKKALANIDCHDKDALRRLVFQPTTVASPDLSDKDALRRLLFRPKYTVEELAHLRAMLKSEFDEIDKFARRPKGDGIENLTMQQKVNDVACLMAFYFFKLPPGSNKEISSIVWSLHVAYTRLVEKLIKEEFKFIEAVKKVIPAPVPQKFVFDMPELFLLPLPLLDIFRVHTSEPGFVDLLGLVDPSPQYLRYDTRMTVKARSVALWKVVYRMLRDLSTYVQHSETKEGKAHMHAVYGHPAKLPSSPTDGGAVAAETEAEKEDEQEEKEEKIPPPVMAPASPLEDQEPQEAPYTFVAPPPPPPPPPPPSAAPRSRKRPLEYQVEEVGGSDSDDPAEPVSHTHPPPQPQPQPQDNNKKQRPPFPPGPFASFFSGILPPPIPAIPQGLQDLVPYGFLSQNPRMFGFAPNVTVNHYHVHLGS